MLTIYVDKNIPKMLATKALKPLVPGVLFSPLSPVRVEELEPPELPGPRWVRLRNKLCGICATDLTFLNLDIDPKIGPAALPGADRFYLGHEVVSEVTEVGPKVTRFQVGDRAIMYTRFHGANCLTQEIEPLCRSCAAGYFLLCENSSLDLAPRGMGGGWGDGYIAHETEVYPVLDGLDDEQAAMVEPISVGVHAALRRFPEPGDHVLVLGCGIVGLNVIQALRAMGAECRITALARYTHQAEMALKLGADEILDGRGGYEKMARVTGARAFEGMLGSRMMLGGFDIVYDNVGSAQTLQDSLRWTRARGAVVLTGVKFAPMQLDLTPVWYREVDLIGVNTHSMESWQGQHLQSFDLTMALLKEKKLSIEGLITHRFGLEQWREAIKTAEDKRTGSIKVMLDCQ